ncbi:hypothetical protein ES703_64506 [subsurface metagenome]
MSNFFGISVAPEIAAAVVKIEANKAVIDENKVILVDLHDTDLPAAVTAVGNNLTAISANNIILADIHDTDLPAAVTAIGGVKTVVDAVQIKTDATPQVVRGTILNGRLETTNPAFQEVCNVTGRGKLYSIGAMLADGADTFEVKFTIDGKSFTEYAHTGDTIEQLVLALAYPFSAGYYLRYLPVTSADQNLLNMDFDTSLIVYVRRSVGTAAAVMCKVYYTLDGF